MGETIEGTVENIKQNVMKNGKPIFFYEVGGVVVSSFAALTLDEVKVKVGDSVVVPVTRNGQYVNYDETQQVTLGKKAVQSVLPATIQAATSKPVEFDSKKDLEIRRAVALKAAVEAMKIIAGAYYAEADAQMIEKDAISMAKGFESYLRG